MFFNINLMFALYNLSMKKQNVDKIKLTVKEILLYLLDANIAYFEAFDRNKIYRKPIKDYWKYREIDKNNLRITLAKLKKQEVIEIYQKNKKQYLELTEKGIERMLKYSLDDLRIETPKNWDKKWRVVIFDIPEEKKVIRDMLRLKLKELGFFSVQKSVFIFPHDCKKELDYLREAYLIKSFVLYMLVDALESDINIFEHFLDQNILSKEMLE